jgi:hypothetical protein
MAITRALAVGACVATLAAACADAGASKSTGEAADATPPDPTADADWRGPPPRADAGPRREAASPAADAPGDACGYRVTETLSSAVDVRVEHTCAKKVCMSAGA